MKQLGDMKLYSFDEIEDEIWGPKGTLERDAMEAQLQRDIEAYKKQCQMNDEKFVTKCKETSIVPAWA